jgi:putative transposase
LRVVDQFRSGGIAKSRRQAAGWQGEFARDPTEAKQRDWRLAANDTLRGDHQYARRKEVTNWRPDFNPDNLYFVTTSAVQRRHLFRRDVMKRLVVDSLDCMRLRGRLRLYVFVVMPNHLHVIIQCLAEDPLADVVRDLKKHIADRLIRHYYVEGNQLALDFLASAVRRPDRQRHSVWEDGYNAKDIFSPEFLRQKMTYAHSNPCQPQWILVERPEDYVWSSARFYLLEEPAIIPLDNVNLLLA